MDESQMIFGTVGNPSSAPDKPGGSVGAIRYLAEQKLYAFEIAWVRSVRVSEKTARKIGEEAEGNGVSLSVHAPYYINLNADDDEWPKSRQRLMDAAQAGNWAGATDIIFHPGSYFEQEPKDVLKHVLPRLEGCVKELRKGNNPVTLRPETMGKAALLGSLEDTLEMAAEIDGVEPCVDFAHLHARRGDGSLNSYDEWSTVLEKYADKLGEKALQHLHGHLSGIEYTEKGEQNHLMLADSDFDLDALIRALVAFDCGGRIVCESPKMEQDAQVIKDTWQRAFSG
ncbi:MAG: TIM barrel protein [Anaerolineales bacterium]